MSYFIVTCVTWLVVLAMFNTVPMDAATVVGICIVNALGFGMHLVIAEIVERVRPARDDWSAWRPGDQFEVIGKDSNHHFKIGDIVTLTYMSPHGDHIYRRGDRCSYSVPPKNLSRL